jgi:hypothetical protein
MLSTGFLFPDRKNKVPNALVNGKKRAYKEAIRVTVSNQRAKER